MTPAEVFGLLEQAGKAAPLVAAGALAAGGLAWGASRLALPRYRRAPAKVIGRAGRRKVGLSVKDASMHVHVLGATGSGKSTLLVNLALQDVRAGRAVAVVDPVGDISRDLLAALPPGAEVCLIDASDPAWAVGLDLLRGDPELVGEHLDGLFGRLWPDSWRARQQVWLRRAILTLAGTGATLADVPRLFADDRFRSEVVGRLDAGDHAARRLVAEWDSYGALSASARAQAAGPLAGKLDLLLLRSSVLHILGQPTGDDPLALLDRGGLVVMRAPQGQVGESAASLLCTAFVALVWDHLRARAGSSRRPPLTLLADECQLAFAPRTLAEMLDLGRKWGLSAVLANQYLGQLSGGLAKAVAANCRTKVAFQVSDEDAWALGGPNRTFALIGASGLARLPEYQAALRVKARPPQVVKTLPPPRRDPNRGRAAVASRARWGRSREEVERLLNGRDNGSGKSADDTGRGSPDLLAYGHANGDGIGVKEDLAIIRRRLTDRDMACLRQIVESGRVDGPDLRSHWGGHASWSSQRLGRLVELGLVERERVGTGGARNPYVYEATEKGRQVAG